MRECSPQTTYHMSHVTCHVSRVTCYVSYDIFFLQNVGAIRCRVCYQRGLPRLVYTKSNIYIMMIMRLNKADPKKDVDFRYNLVGASQKYTRYSCNFFSLNLMVPSSLHGDKH